MRKRQTTPKGLQFFGRIWANCNEGGKAGNEYFYILLPKKAYIWDIPMI